MAATEFALIAPVLLIMYFGLAEYTLAQDARTKATLVASTAADLIAQEKEVCDPEMADAFVALAAIMYPFSSTMKVKVSSIIDNGNGTVKVAWSEGHNTAARTVNSSVTIPSGLVSTGGSVIMSEIEYSYNSPTNHMFPTNFSMTDTFYLHPRKAAQITRTMACN